MALRLKTKVGDVLRDAFALTDNPFKTSETYNLDGDSPYVREMYGPQLKEFHQKFFVLPLTKTRSHQVIGAIWSSHAGSEWGKGFGKSMLMAEESRLANRDFGEAILRGTEVEEEDIPDNPFLAGYCTFDHSKEVKTFPAALLDAVIFILTCPHQSGVRVHEALRMRALSRLGAATGDMLHSALDTELRKYRGLNIQLNHAKIAKFCALLADGNTDELVEFTRHDIGPRIKSAQGFNFVHVFNAFAALAGIRHIAYFIDQIENFATWTSKQDREIKILRESIVQTSPTAEVASFIFQMHIRAQRGIEDWWNSEHLPSLDYNRAINSARVVDLRGLQKPRDAIGLATAYLDRARVEGADVPPLHPFSEEVIELVRRARNGNPRKFLEALSDVLDQAITQSVSRIDPAFVESLLADAADDDASETAELDNPER